TIMFKEYAQNKLNPAYYIWRFLKNANSPQAGDIKVQVITRAPLQPDQSFDHPLLKTLNLNLNTAIKPRIEANALMPGQANPTNVLLFPTDPLSNWDGIQWSASAQSTIEWHITNDANLQFETRLKTGVSVANLQGVDISATPLASQQTLIQQVWSAWGDAINETCLELQFPAELTAVTIAHESFNNPRAVRLEPLVIPTTIAKGSNDPKRNQELRLQNQGVSQTVIDGYKNLTIPNGFSTLSGPGPSPGHGPDPNQWPGTSVINAASSTLTWDDLLQIIDVVPERMSPGLMQTLVSAAIANYTWLQTWYSDISGTFGVADPYAAGPPSPSDWFRWLLIGPHSILLGTAYHKHAYIFEGSRMNLPRIASLYNAGQRTVAGQIEPRDAPQLTDPDIAGNPTKPNPWRMRYNNLRYPRDVTREYNAISSQFNTGVNGLARFWRTLP
ncbi:MAG TPA: hypothetical protein VFN23_12275, partial [Ktedonobacteraceae bacterium]|nr:hypothetical protein [Ktedonobacteraceae bacterium]